MGPRTTLPTRGRVAGCGRRSATSGPAGQGEGQERDEAHHRAGRSFLRAPPGHPPPKEASPGCGRGSGRKPRAARHSCVNGIAERRGQRAREGLATSASVEFREPPEFRAVVIGFLHKLWLTDPHDSRAVRAALALDSPVCAPNSVRPEARLRRTASHCAEGDAERGNQGPRTERAHCSPAGKVTQKAAPGPGRISSSPPS